jgi:hypothetical protein
MIGYIEARANFGPQLLVEYHAQQGRQSNLSLHQEAIEAIEAYMNK